MNPGRNLRMIGLVLIIAGVSLGAVLERVAKARARYQVARTKMLTRVQEPGVIVTMLGVALLDASDAPELQQPAKK